MCIMDLFWTLFTLGILFVWESGCDGVLGSGTQLDRCGVCGGDGTTCRVIRGIFTRTHLTHRGYNIVTTIPRGACSINITEMSRSSNHLALSTPTGYFLNGDMRLQGEGEVKGAGTTFTYKRATGGGCPGECLTAPGPLNTSLRVELIYFGRNPGIFYQFTIPRDETHDVISSMVSTNDNGQPAALRRPSAADDVSGVQTQSDTDPDSPRRDIIPRIKYGKSPVHLPDTDSQPGTQQLRISSRVTSSQNTGDLHSRNYVRSQDSSRRHARPQGTSSYTQGSHNRRTSHLSHIKHHDRDTNRSHNRHRHERQRVTEEGTSTSNVAYEPTRGQFYVKGENGSIQYKHYYHTNVHDDLGDEPMAAPLEEDGQRPGGPRYDTAPRWVKGDARDDRYAEFRGTTQYQPTARSSSIPNAISSSVVSQSNVGPAPPPASVVANQRSSYNGYDNRLSPRDDTGNGLYSWRILGLTACSEPCGGGLQETRVVCVKGDSQVEVIEENCNADLKPAITTIVCNNQPCKAAWDISGWSPCSVTCGRGLQKRTVECKQRISPTLTISVSSTNCPNTQPQSRQYCLLDPCFTWRTSEWGKCSSECGFGQRSRSLACVDAAGTNVSESLCTQVRPTTEEICDMGSCAEGWFHTKWSKQCSAECGRGHYTRQVYCSAPDGSPLDEKKCGGPKSKPREKKSCKATKPCGGQWFTGPWSQCNSTCGSDSYRVRDVLCIKRHGKRVNQVVKEHNCVKEDKPADKEPCGPFPDCKPQWFMMAWSECSKSCGTGVRTREVKCLDATLTSSPECDKDKKPSRRRPCNTQHCKHKYAAFSETPVTTTNEALQMDGSSTIHHHHGCSKDKQSSRWCHLAKQARLCYYPYYKKICCHTCRKLDPKPH